MYMGDTNGELEVAWFDALVIAKLLDATRAWMDGTRLSLTNPLQ